MGDGLSFCCSALTICRTALRVAACCGRPYSSKRVDGLPVALSSLPGIGMAACLIGCGGGRACTALSIGANGAPGCCRRRGPWGLAAHCCSGRLLADGG